jgi:hypothetical protein
METCYVHDRRFDWRVVDQQKSWPGLPRLANDKSPQTILHVLSDGGFEIAAWVHREYTRDASTTAHESGIDRQSWWKFWSSTPRLAIKSKLRIGAPSYLGPLLVMGTGFPTQQNAVARGRLIEIQPRIAFLRRRMISKLEMDRLLQWCLSDGFRARDYSPSSYEPIEIPAAAKDSDPLTLRNDEQRRAHCLQRGIDPTQHCCLDMAWFISDPIEWESQGQNPVLMWIGKWNEYRIHISRQGNSSTPIRVCPWCGRWLPNSRRGEWNRRLKQMGYRDPGEDKIPPEFNSDAWWRRLSS